MRPLWLDIAINAAIGLAFGALGYIGLNWWHEDLKVSGSVIVSFLAVIVTIIGWTVSQRAQDRSLAISQRAQERLFLHQVKHAARSEIVAAVRRYQDAYRAWSMTVFSLAASFEAGLTKTWNDPDWRRWLEDFAAKRNEITPLTTTFEEYELLYRATKTGRQDFAVFSGKTYVQLSDLQMGVIGTPAARDRACAQAEAIYDRMFEEILLLEDLLVYVQNEALGDIVGRHVPFFRPKKFAHTPRFELRAEGLRLTDGNGVVLFPRGTEPTN